MKYTHFLLLAILSVFLISTVSGLTINTTEITESSIEITFTPELNVSTSPKVWVNNAEIETPIKDTLILSDLKPNSSYHISIYFDNTESEYYGDYYQLHEQTLQSESIPLEVVIYQYGYILLILAVLIGIAYVKLPFGGFIPFFLSMGGIIHYLKYDIQEPQTIIIYVVLLIISVYVIYLGGETK